MTDIERKAMEMALEWVEAQKQPRMIGSVQVIQALRQALEESANSTTIVVESKTLAQPEQEPETVMAKYEFQTYAAYKTDGEIKIGVVPEQEPVVGMFEEKLPDQNPPPWVRDYKAKEQA